MAQEKRTTKSKSEYFLDNDEASSSSTIKKRLKRAPTEDSEDEVSLETHKKRRIGEGQLEKLSINYTVDNIIQKTKKDNNELMSILSDLNLVKVAKNKITVSFKESMIIDLPQLSENKFQ
ncbi:5681_t:CDS:1, partial [Racocetra fulgida]